MKKKKVRPTKQPKKLVDALYLPGRYRFRKKKLKVRSVYLVGR